MLPLPISSAVHWILTCTEREIENYLLHLLHLHRFSIFLPPSVSHLSTLLLLQRFLKSPIIRKLQSVTPSRRCVADSNGEQTNRQLHLCPRPPPTTPSDRNALKGPPARPASRRMGHRKTRAVPTQWHLLSAPSEQLEGRRAPRRCPALPWSNVVRPTTHAQEVTQNRTHNSL